MTYSKEIGGFSGSFVARPGSVLGIWRAPGPGVVTTDRMLDFDDLGPVGRRVNIVNASGCYMLNTNCTCSM